MAGYCQYNKQFFRYKNELLCHSSKPTTQSPFCSSNPAGRSSVIVHSSPFFTSDTSFLKHLMLLENISPVKGVPFLNTYILFVFESFPLTTLTPGTSTESSPPFFPFILNSQATSARPFSLPFITAPLRRAIAVSSKSLRKLWMRRWTLGTTLVSFCRKEASELGSTPKVRISALQVSASSMSLAVTSPMPDLRMLTVMSFLALSLSTIGRSCQWIVSSMPRSAKRRMTLKLLLLTPMFTRNWQTYFLWFASSSSFSPKAPSNFAFAAASPRSSSIFSTISSSFSWNLASHASLLADPYIAFRLRQSSRIFAVLTVFFCCSLDSYCRDICLRFDVMNLALFSSETQQMKSPAAGTFGIPIT